MPRARNPMVIVPFHEILSHDYIQEEHWTLMTLLSKIQTKLQCIQWLAQRRLLQNQAVCERCDQPATLNTSSQSVDGYRWKCNPCNWTKCIRSESWFYKSHISLQKLVQMTYFWSIDTPHNIVVGELELDRKTVTDWFNCHRDACCEWVDNHFDPIGGLDDNQKDTIVEINEICFCRKNDVGPQQWVFGGVDRRTKKCFLVPVADRERTTLDPLIKKYIQPGTRIISDGWEAYNHIAQLGGGTYTHDIVTPQQNLVDQGIHMQSMESLWKRAKKKLLNQSGTTRALFPSLKEFMWLENACKSENLDIFSGFMKLISVKQNLTIIAAGQFPTTIALPKAKVVSRSKRKVRALPARLADAVIPEQYRIYEVQPGESEYKTKPMQSSIRMLNASKYRSESSDSDVEDDNFVRPKKTVAISDANDSSEDSNSAEWASDSDDLEHISYSDLYEVDSSEDSNPSERAIAIGDLENVSEADSSKGSDASELSSDDQEETPKPKKRRKMMNGNVAKNGDVMDRISNGKVKKYVKQDKFPSDMSEFEKTCLVCRTGKNIVAKHPLFIGGLCKEHMLLCHEKFFEYDSDGYSSSCCICSMGTSLVACNELDCVKSYCKDCLTRFIDSGVYKNAAKSKNWICNFCKNSKEGLLRKRAGWQEEIQRLYKNTDPQFPPFPVLPTVPQHERKPIRVLSLFDGISAGAVALKQLGIEIERFVASEIHEDAIRLVKNRHPEIIHIGDVTKLSDKEIYAMGPFDLVLGGSPCNDLSSVNPKRKGLIDAGGTGCLFFDYYRILRTVEPPLTNDLCYTRPFFWLFENVTSMKEIEKQRISRFLQCEPRMADARYVSAACRSRLFWGNLPGLMDRELTPGVNDRLTVQDCLESGRKARVEKLNTITAKYSSLYQGMQNRAPVVHDGEEDVLWATEVERVFGVPEHYTDVNNLGPRERVALLGRSWSVPVVRQLLSPLEDYFKCCLD